MIFISWVSRGNLYTCMCMLKCWLLTNGFSGKSPTVAVLFLHCLLIEPCYQTINSTINPQHFQFCIHKITTVQLISDFMLASTESCLFFSCTWLKLVYSITQLTYSSLYLIVTSLLVCTRALTRAACIANTLWVLIGCHVFTWVCRVHYLSSSNSTVNIRIGNHIRNGRGLILLVTRPSKINHLMQITLSSLFAS